MRKLHAMALMAAIVITPLAVRQISAQETLISLDGVNQPTVISTQWVKPSEDGAVAGKVIVPGSENGDMVGEVVLATGSGAPTFSPVSSSGAFELRDVKPGVYTIVYQSPKAFSAFALQVVDRASSAKLGSQVTILAAPISPEVALSAVAKYQPSQVDQNAYQIGDAKKSTPSITVGEKISQVFQNRSGGLTGRLVQAGSTADGLLAAVQVNVMVYREGEEVKRTQTDADGNFAISELAPGFYSLVASGKHGFAVVGFELLPNPEVLTSFSPVTSGRAVVSQNVPTQVIIIELAPPDPSLLGPNGFPASSDDRDLAGPVPFDPLAPGPGMGSGFGGGGFGGGGFGGGGGGGFGGGGLGGLAAIGAVLAATLADDDDNNNFTPVPASPSIP